MLDRFAVVARSSLDRAVSGLVVPWKRIFSDEVHPIGKRRVLNLFHQFERPALARRLLGAILHFQACEIQRYAHLCKHFGNVIISIVPVGIVVTSGQFCGMRRALVPPVDTSHFSGDVAATAGGRTCERCLGFRNRARAKRRNTTPKTIFRNRSCSHHR